MPTEVAAPASSMRLKIYHFVTEPFPPYTYKWMSQGVQHISPESIDNLLVFYFQSVYSAVPIGEERDIRTLFKLLQKSDPSGNGLLKALVFAFCALSAIYQKDRDQAEWCYAVAKDALSKEPNDAQFEYLFASTLLVSLLDRSPQL
jgi:hypothetical protein